jgi:SAM-dependent methyltransferase
LFDEINLETQQIKHATVTSFGEEWKRFDKLLDSYQQNYRDYFSPYGPEFFQGKIGLDAGCGMGRHVYWAAQYGAEMVAVDLSQAVEVAFRNVHGCPNIHVVQADIYHLPFSRESFDFVQSIGVIHHLPDPEGGLQLLSDLVKPGGCLFVYLYTKRGREPVFMLGKAKLYLKEKMYRKVGRLLPHWLLNYYTLGYAVAGRILFNIPYKILSRLAFLHDRLENMPLRYYADYPLYVLHTDIYDWVATPLSHHYDLEELEQIFVHLPFQSIEYRRNPEWRVFAWK